IPTTYLASRLPSRHLLLSHPSGRLSGRITYTRQRPRIAHPYSYGCRIQWCRLLVRFCGERTGRARLLCPGISDVDLFRYREGIIPVNAKISDGAFDLGVAEQELHSP